MPQDLRADRRQFLHAAAALGAAAATAAWPLRAGAQALPTRIDVHAHALPDFYRSAFDAHGGQATWGEALPDWSAASALAFMDRFGIRAQVVSLPAPGLSFLPDLDARVQMARMLNDHAHDELVWAPAGSAQRGRFGAFATLPLGDPRNAADVTAARAEARRALVDLKLDGVVLYTSYQGVYLGDSKLAPLMQTLNTLKARVMVIPVAPASTPADAAGLQIDDSTLELPFETTRAATHLLYTLAYVLYPSIRWLFSEGGGATPFLSYRSGLLALDFNPRVSAYAGLYFDTVQAAAPAAVASMRAVTELGHILLGTDFPHAAARLNSQAGSDPQLELNASFTSTERQQVDRANALALLPTLAQRLALA